MISTYSRSSKRAFSLIEVAIALAIFVIGALAIIKIFPGALNLINNNGDQQIATNLNRSVIVELKSQDTLVNASSGPSNGQRTSFNSVPDATFNLALNNDGTLFWTAGDANHSADYGTSSTAVIGVPRFNGSLPTTQEINNGLSDSALSRYRAIQGEYDRPFVVTDGVDSQAYALTQFPISIKQGTGGLTPLFPTVSQDVVLQNVRIDRQGGLDFARATTIDGKLLSENSPGQIVLNQITDKSVIYATYRYWDNASDANNRRVWGVSEEAIPVTSTAVPATNKITDVNITAVKVSPPTAVTAARGAFGPYNASDNAASKTGVVPGVIEVRVRKFIGAGDFDGTSATDKVPDARRGLVKLPNVVGVPVDLSRPVAIDYVADWSLLMQKGVPLLAPEATPAPGPGTPMPATPPTYRQIALGAPFVEDREKVGIYSLLIGNPNNLATGPTLYKSVFGADFPEPAAEGKLVKPSEDELRAGKVTFKIDDPTFRARVAYRTRDGWVQQLSVAATSYTPHAFIPAGTGGTASQLVEPWRDYYVGNDNYLYFHAGEAGKAVNITYSYGPDTNNGDTNVVSRPYVISAELVSAQGLNLPTSFAGVDEQVARVQLISLSGDVFPFKDAAGNTYNLKSIQNVRGTSLTVRTAYINGDHYAQTLLTGNRGSDQ